jgi:hypothetical protein
MPLAAAAAHTYTKEDTLMVPESLLHARHVQREGRRFAAWCGFTLHHFMVGFDVDRHTRCVTASLGPFYVGVGSLYDRETA